MPDALYGFVKVLAPREPCCSRHTGGAGAVVGGVGFVVGGVGVVVVGGGVEPPPPVLSPPTGGAFSQPRQRFTENGENAGVFAENQPILTPALKDPRARSTLQPAPPVHEAFGPNPAFTCRLPAVALPTPIWSDRFRDADALPDICRTPSTHTFDPSCQNP